MPELSHATPPRDLTPQEVEELATRAHALDSEVARIRTAMGVAQIYLAEVLCEVMDKRLWQVLDYESENAYFASPHVPVKKDYGRKLIRIYREYVEQRGMTKEELKDADIECLQIALPAVKKGRAGILDVVSDAKVLPRGDMAERYRKGDPNARLDAEAEPERAACSNCGSYVPVERLKDAAA